ncbi:MAG: histone deacetylase family protein [Candidatus Bathyarchaeia archaeon]
MKIVFHKNYCRVYSSDPAAAPGRMESIMKELSGFEVVEPEMAMDEDVALVHGKSHIEYVKSTPVVYETALLAVGGAIKASEIAMKGEPAFGVVRPPGHHASQNSCWGFCYFNNVAVSVERLLRKGLIAKAVILDIDLHYGDGTANIFANSSKVLYHHIADGERENFFNDLKEFLSSISKCDIVAVSAGFDRHEQDWGGVLSTSDYFQTAEIVKDFAERVCSGRRYAVLEGGYNHKVLGKNVKAFVEGFE